MDVRTATLAHMRASRLTPPQSNTVDFVHIKETYTSNRDVGTPLTSGSAGYPLARSAPTRGDPAANRTRRR